jgi:hypothetical protein
MRSKVEFFEEKSTENVIVPKARQEKPWRWRVKARNGEIVTSSESYVSKSNAKRGFVDAYNVMAEAYTDHVYENEDGNWRGEPDAERF